MGVKVDGYVPQGQGAFETQKRRHPRLHQTARLRGLGGSAEVSKARTVPATWLGAYGSFLGL